MALLFDDDVIAYQLIAITIPSTRPNPYFIYYSCPEVQLTNIRLWGIHRVYRLRSIITGTRPTQFDAQNLRAPDHAFQVVLAPGVGIQDGIQFIPVYELARVVILDNIV